MNKLPFEVPAHAFAIGGLGGMTYGMMSRVSLGHTGRALRPVPIIVVGYYLLNLSALIRVFGPLIYRGHYNYWIATSGGLWIIGFILFIGVYFPILTQPRIDGKIG
jgi:uncharacterized protein involved in response to NO